MYKDRIEYLKRAIKRTYKCYIGEIQDENASLKDVTDFFNISIDEARLDDYFITKIDFNTPSLELIDKKTNTTYISEYTYKAKLLNYYGDEVKFNSLLSLSPNHKVEKLYYIGDTIPIIEKMTFKDGEYDLVFEREFDNSVGLFINNGIRLAIRYLQQMEYKDRNIEQRLLNKIYKDSYKDGKHIESFEQLYTYSPNFYLKRDDSQDKYTYVRNNNVVYGIGELEQREDHHILRGICFENISGNLKNYFPYNMNADNYLGLKDEKNTSAMIFKGFVDKYRHSLEIYKNGSNAIIMYNVIERDFDEIIVNQQLTIPLLNTGNISSDEIQTIITTLQKQYNNDEFINLVLCELLSFGKKIDIRKGLVEEEIDMLNPKLYINKSFDDIAELIDNNKENFFKLIAEQFKSSTNISQDSKKFMLKL